MVKQVRTHYGKKQYEIPKHEVECRSGSGEVIVYYMTPEEIKEYFDTKYPHLKKKE